MRRRGFTLVEILAVIVVVAMAAAIAVPNLSSTIRGQRLRDFYSGLRRLPTQASELAQRLGTPVNLTLTEEGGFLLQNADSDSDEGTALATLEPVAGVEFSGFRLNDEDVAEGEWIVSFYPDGTADRALLQLDEGGTSQLFRVDPKTSRGTLTYEDAESQPIEKWEAD